jgi:hypothetical protein
MTSKIILKKSSETGKVPASLDFGELALNYADGKLYYKNASNVIVDLSGNPYTAGTDLSLQNYVFNHTESGVVAGSYNNVTVNSRGHVTAGSNTAYLTSESDTLSSVTGRGNTTSSNIGVSGGTTLNLAASGNIGTWIGGIQDASTGWSLDKATIGFKADNNTYAGIGIGANNGFLYFGRTEAGGVGTLSSWLEVDASGTANFKRARPQHNGNNLATTSEINSYAPTLTGSGASGTWNINITGSAGNADTVDGRHADYFYPAVTPNGYIAGDINGNTTHQRLWGTDSVQDLLQFRPPTNVEYSTDGVNWTSTTINNDVFDGRVFNKWGSYSLNVGNNIGGWRHVRLTWVNFGYHFWSHLTLAHSTNGHSFNLVFYKSDTSGNFTTESFRQNGISSWPGYTFVKYSDVSGWWDTRDVRIVFELNHNNDFPDNSIGIGHLGLMGSYSSFTRLYDWDYNRNITTTGSFRAPIFYDNNDTNYYVDPNSGSRLATAHITQLGVGSSNNPSFDFYNNGTSYFNGVVTIDDTLALTASNQINFYSPNGSIRGYINATDTDDNHLQIATSGNEDIVFKDAGPSGTRNFVIRGGNTGSEAYGSFRSPIFYDSNDTGYYVNPNSTSNLYQSNFTNTSDHAISVGTIRGRAVNSQSGDYIHMYERVHIGYPSGWGGISAPTYGLSTWGQIEWNRSQGGSNWGWGSLSLNSGWGGTGNYPTIGSAGGSSGSLIMLHNPHVPFRTDNARSGASGRAGLRLAANVSADSYWDVGLIGDEFEVYRGASGTQQLSINSSGDVSARASVRGTIFYDVANTAWYLDPSASVATILSTAASADTLGYNTNYGIYIGGIDNRYIYSGNSSNDGPIFHNGSSANRIWHTGNLTNLSQLTNNIGYVSKTQSQSDFVNGTLVQTNIPSSGTDGDSFRIEVTGKSYGAGVPFMFLAEGYLYSDTIIATSGIHLGHPGFSTLKVFNYGGNLAFWWPRVSYWNSFEVRALTTTSSNNSNRVTSISNAVEPTDGTVSKKVNISMASYMRSDTSSTNADTIRATNFRAFNAYYLGENNYYFNNVNDGWFSNVKVQSEADMRAPVFYDYNNTGYYLDPAGTPLSLKVAGNIDLYARSDGWAEGIRIRVPNSSTWGGVRFTRDRGNFDGNWAVGYTGIDSTDDLTFWGSLAGSEAMKARMDLSANFTVYGSMRSPIFYDSNDTAYYADPASTSRLNVVHANYYLGEITDSGNGDSNAPYRFESDYSGWVFLLANTPGTGNGWGTFWAGNDNPAYTYFSSSNPNEYVFVGAGSVKASIDLDNGQSYFGTSVRSPIFYDSEDTGYYLDPNSTSNSALRVRGGTLYGPNVTWGASLYVGTDGRVGSSATVAVTNGNLHLDSQNGYQMYLNWYSTENIYTQGNMGIGNSSASYRLHVHGTGYATSDFRAPILYDSDDTGFYLDPNNTGIALSTNGIVSSGTGTNGGFQNRTYTSGRNRIWSFGNADGYGLSYFQGGTDYIGLHFGTATQASSQFWASADGISQSSASSRAPIFYDSNDTNYYTDPNSTSVMWGILHKSAVSNDVSGLRNVNPGGGSVITGSSSITGAIKIKLPVNEYPMVRFTVKVYTYDGLSFDVTCGGHTSGGTWYNTFAYMTTANRPALNVRFTYGGGNVYVYIGELNTTWSYPQVFITDVQVGYSNYEYTKWDDNWTIEYDSSSYNSISATHTVYSSVYSTNNTSAIYAAILYDSNDTNYYLNPNSISRLDATETNQSYTYGWFRNYTNNTGLYNQNTTQHLSSNTNGYWDMSSTTSVSAIRFYTGGHVSALRGYVYADTSNSIGFLNSSGSWRLRVVENDYSLADGSSMRAQLYYDSNNTAYYVDPASFSKMSSASGMWMSGTDNPADVVNASTWYGLGRSDVAGWTPGGMVQVAGYAGLRLRSASTFLELEGPTYGTGWAYVNSPLASGTRLDAPIFYDSNNTGYYLDPNSTGTSLNVAGSITAAGNISASSDVRLKEDIQIITNAVDKVKQINGVTYTRKETKKRHSGVIAQDVIKVLPEVVEGTEESMYSVSYGNMVGLLIEAIKEQQSEIDELKQLVKQLLNK